MEARLPSSEHVCLCVFASVLDARLPSSWKLSKNKKSITLITKSWRLLCLKHHAEKHTHVFAGHRGAKVGVEGVKDEE